MEAKAATQSYPKTTSPDDRPSKALVPRKEYNEDSDPTRNSANTSDVSKQAVVTGQNSNAPAPSSSCASASLPSPSKVGPPSTPRAKIATDLFTPSKSSTSSSSIRSNNSAPSAAATASRRKAALSKPFKSPLIKRDPSHHNLALLDHGDPALASSSKSLLAAPIIPSRTKQITYGARSTSSSSSSCSTTLLSSSRTGKMSEAGKLRERLRVLKQAVKCVEDSTLQTLPPLIKKWRKAGHEAARDLWTLGGGGEWDACPPSRHASFGSYHPENSEIIGEQPPSPLRSETETKLSALYKLKPRVRKRDRREDDEGGSNCEEWFGNGEDDQERLHPSKVSRVSSSNGTEGSSPPPLEELFKQARSCAKVKVYGGGGGNFTRPRSAAEYEDQGGDYEEAEPSSSTNAEHSSWNIGKMLDLIGVERSSLKWNEEEEDFDEEEEEEEEEERKRGMP